MIDDKKKIEEAAFDFNDGELMSDKFIRAAFICGAKWAINEFLKDLWHHAEEEPNHEAIRTYILGKQKQVSQVYFLCY